MARNYKKKEALPVNGPKQERVLSCSRCDMTITLNLAPQDERPMHRCSKLYKAMPFDKDQSVNDITAASKRKWFEEKPKHPRPRASGDSRPQIVL